MNKVRLQWSIQTTISYIVPDVEQIEGKLKRGMVLYNW